MEIQYINLFMEIQDMSRILSIEIQYKNTPSSVVEILDGIGCKYHEKLNFSIFSNLHTRVESRLQELRISK